MGAKTYTEIVRAAPTNPAAALAAGGSLVVGTTYYYHIVAMSCEGWSVNIAHINCESPPSTEVSATPTAGNQTINLTWDAMAGADYYAVIRTLTSGDYSLTGCKIVFTTANTPITTNSYSDTGGRIYDSWREYPNGLPCVQLDGGSSSDYIDEDWIYTQMTGGTLGTFVTRIQDVSASYTLGYFFNCAFALGATSGNPTYFTIKKGKMIMVNGRWDNCANYLTMKFGELVGNLGYLGPCIQFLGKVVSSGAAAFPAGDGYMYGTRLMDYMGEKGGAVAEGVYWAYRSIVGQPWGGSTNKFTVRNSVITTSVSGSWGGYLDLINNMTSYAYYFFVPAPERVYFSGGYISTGSCYSYDYNGEVNDVNFQYLGTEFLYHGSTNYKTFIMRNCTLFHDPPMGNGVTNPSYTRYYVIYSLDLTVTDQDGAALSGATVQIEDVNGYNCVWVDSGAELGEQISVAEVADISVSDGSLFSVDDVIMINMEKMTVTAASGVTDLISVDRDAFEDVWQPNGRIHWYSAGVGNSTIWKRQASLTTDANGAITQQRFIVDAHYDYNSGGATNYKYTKTSHNPHKITISKTGYETLVLDNCNLTKKSEWRVELQKSHRMDIDGEIYQSTNADNHLVPL